MSKSALSPCWRNGKIHRLSRPGSVPKSNRFVLAKDLSFHKIWLKSVNNFWDILVTHRHTDSGYHVQRTHSHCCNSRNSKMTEHEFSDIFTQTDRWMPTPSGSICSAAAVVRWAVEITLHQSRYELKCPCAKTVHSSLALKRGQWRTTQLKICRLQSPEVCEARAAGTQK